MQHKSSQLQTKVAYWRIRLISPLFKLINTLLALKDLPLHRLGRLLSWYLLHSLRTLIEIIATGLLLSFQKRALGASCWRSTRNLVILKHFSQQLLVILSLHESANGIDSLNRNRRSLSIHPSTIELQQRHRALQPHLLLLLLLLLWLNIPHLIMIELNNPILTRSSLHCSLQSFTKSPLEGW